MNISNQHLFSFSLQERKNNYNPVFFGRRSKVPEKQVIQLLNNHVSVVDIAQICNVSVEQVYSFIRKMKLKSPKAIFKEEKYQKILELLRQDYTVESIAEVVRIPCRKIYTKVKNYFGKTIPELREEVKSSDKEVVGLDLSDVEMQVLKKKKSLLKKELKKSKELEKKKQIEEFANYIKSQIELGKSTSELIRESNLDKCNFFAKLNRCKINLSTLKKEVRLNKIKECLAQNMSIADIAKEINATRMTVYRYIRIYNLR